MSQDHTFVLTNKQANKLIELLDSFIEQGNRAITPQFMLLIGGVRRSMLDGDGLDQNQIDVCVLLMDMIFSVMGEDDFDPQLEQAYYKLTGYWPVDPPWYERNLKDVK